MENKVVVQILEKVIALDSDIVCECDEKGKWVAAGLTAYDNFLGSQGYDSPINVITAVLDEYKDISNQRKLTAVQQAIAERLYQALEVFAVISENYEEIFGEDD